MALKEDVCTILSRSHILDHTAEVSLWSLKRQFIYMIKNSSEGLKTNLPIDWHQTRPTFFLMRQHQYTKIHLCVKILVSLHIFQFLENKIESNLFTVWKFPIASIRFFAEFIKIVYSVYSIFCTAYSFFSSVRILFV